MNYIPPGADLENCLYIKKTLDAVRQSISSGKTIDDVLEEATKEAIEIGSQSRY